MSGFGGGRFSASNSEAAPIGGLLHFRSRMQFPLMADFVAKVGGGRWMPVSIRLMEASRLGAKRRPFVAAEFLEVQIDLP